MDINIPFKPETDADIIIDYLRDNGWIYGTAPNRGCGSDYDSKWCESFASCMGDKFDNGLSLIDWGCGYGRFLNHMLFKDIEKFTYYGFETPSRNNGDLLTSLNKKIYGDLNDSNKKINFGFINDHNLFNKSQNECDTILLGSVFTHIGVYAAQAFIEMCSPVLYKEGGSIVFSVIFGSNYMLGPPGYNYPGSYEIVTYTDNELQLLKFGGKYKIEQMSTYMTGHGREHTIFNLTLC